MNAAWAAFSAWDTDPATGGGTQPTLSVAGRVDGQGYSVSAGARSITITAEAGATLVTTAHGPTSGAVTVTDDTTTTPDWTAPADEALTLKVEATKDGLTSEVTFTEQTAYGGGGSLVSMIDLSGVSYNFLTTGGTGGSGGPGPHTVAGLTWTMSNTGTGASRLEIVSGVLHVESDSTNRSALVIDQGVDLLQRPWVVYCSIANASRASGTSMLGFYVSESATINGGNQAQMLAGTTSATKLLQRENTTSSPAFTTLQDATVTDLTTTPTLMAVHGLAGSWVPSWSQGSAVLPTDGSKLGTTGSMWMEAGGAVTGQDRVYVVINPIDDCDIRLASYILEIAP